MNINIRRHNTLFLPALAFRYEGGLITFVAVGCAIFSFPVLIVGLFNFLRRKKERNKSFLKGSLRRKMLMLDMFPYQPPSTLWHWEHCSFNGRDSAVLGVLQQTHIDAMEVDTPVGSGPGRNITIAMLAGGRQRGARGCQSAHRSYGFLHDEQKRRKAFVDWGPNPNRPWWRIWQLEN